MLKSGSGSLTAAELKRTRAAMERHRRENGSINTTRVAADLNVRRSTVQNRIAIIESMGSTAPEPKPARKMGAEELQDAIHGVLKTGSRSPDALAKQFSVPSAAVVDAIEAMADNGVKIEFVKVTGHYTITTTPPAAGYLDGPVIEITSRKDNTFCFLASGDLHAGSKYSRYDVREDLIRRAEDRGAQAILDTGNWIDGEARFNKHDLEAVGLDAQIKMLAARHPKTKLPVYAVAGDDHEGWYEDREGINIGWYCEKTMREAGHNWTNLGYMEAHIRLVNANSGKTQVIAVVHPGGGSAYAMSYRPQKIIESYEGGEKPAVAVYGHYHKLDAGNVRNVWYGQTGCFDGRAHVRTETGYRRISSIKSGDRVWTHKNRLADVTAVTVQDYSGDAFEITAGPTGAYKRGRIAATAEHPFLTLRGWVPACRLTQDDWVAVEQKTAADGSAIPHYRDHSEAERPRKLIPNKTPRPSRHNEALDAYIATLPRTYRIIPTHQVLPDAIAIDWDSRRVLAVELERDRCNPSNPCKYDLVPGRYDDVLWVCTARDGTKKQYEYRVVDGNVFVPIRKIRKLAWSRRVYNLSVAEDESYQCGRFVVHNCCQDQTPFMRKKSLEAHVGGLIVGLEQDPRTGAIIGFDAGMLRYFNREYYNIGKRWSRHGPVGQPPRSR
jgi:biotin operon repressor